MKKTLKGFILGVIVTALLMGMAFAETVTRKIEVVYNSINVTINGKKVEEDNILYEGTTYLPLRAVAEALDMEVAWDQATKTASIKDKEEVNLAKVTRVIDGDTLEVEFKNKTERVRLIGVDTPESVHPDAAKNLPEGKVASDYTKSKLEGKEVELEFDVQERDKYGRLLAYVWIDGIMYNQLLLEEGYAQVATFPPNVKYVDDFINIQQQAREDNKGLWNQEGFNGEQTTIVKTSGKYVASLESDKYHKPTCRHAKNIASYNEIWFDTGEEANNAGYKACGVCKP